MTEDPRTALAVALGALGATLRLHRGLGATELTLGGEYLLAPAAALRRQEEQLQGCRRCKLCEGRSTIVFGSGSPRAELVVIGEGPGAEEDAQGKPFVGRAGQLLSRMLAARGVEFARDDVYITNAVKCFISPGVPVYTARGYRPIGNLRVGDLVLTHRGRFRKVVYLRPLEILPAGSDVVRIAVDSADRDLRPVHLTVTPEHPFLVNGAWKQAGEIKTADRVTMLGDPCEACGQTYFVRYDRYERRTLRTCGPCCDKGWGCHRPTAHLTRVAQTATGRRGSALGARVAAAGRVPVTARISVRSGPGVTGVRSAQDHGPLPLNLEWVPPLDQPDTGAEALRPRLRNHPSEYAFVEAPVVSVEPRRISREFRLYNIGVEEDESFVAAGVVSHNCRPPGNRNPEPDELASCAPFLAAQLGALRPKVVLALGSVAAQTLLRTREPIGKLRGHVHPFGAGVLVATFHPAFLLRNPGDEYKRMAWEDLKLARREYDRRRTRGE